MIGTHQLIIYQGISRTVYSQGRRSTERKDEVGKCEHRLLEGGIANNE